MSLFFFRSSVADACMHHRDPYPYDHEDDPKLDVNGNRELKGKPVVVAPEPTPAPTTESFFDDDAYALIWGDVDDHCLAYPTQEEIAQGNETMTEYYASNNNRRALEDTTTPIIIPVVIHRIMYEPERPFGATDEMIVKQMQVLNTAFSPYFAFVQINQTETYNRDWYPFLALHRPHLIADMKTTLHQGGADTLNMYLAQPRFLGIATYPQAVKTDPILDGIIVNVRSMPDGDLPRFNLGMTAVHEVGTLYMFLSFWFLLLVEIPLTAYSLAFTGHWLGLFHTFEVRICLTDARLATGHSCLDAGSLIVGWHSRSFFLPLVVLTLGRLRRTR